MKLSVVIPCHNSAATLGSLLESLAAQSWSEPWEVVIVDNRSSDDSVAIAERFRPRLPNLKIVAAHERGGAAYARNVGARAASGEALAFCDADDEVGTGWLAAIGKALTKWDCVAARLEFKKSNPPIVAKHNSWHEQCSGLQKAWYPPYLQHFGGGTFGIKRAIHEKIGGFDERYIALEDTEYCFRLQQAGYRIQFMLDVVMHIRARQDLLERLFQTIKYATYNVFLAQGVLTGYDNYLPILESVFQRLGAVSHGTTNDPFHAGFGKVRMDSRLADRGPEGKCEISVRSSRVTMPPPRISSRLPPGEDFGVVYA